MNEELIHKHLRQANEVALRAKRMGRHPFGAILVAPDQVTVLAEQGNIDTVQHAESTLARAAYLNYPQDFLKGCALVSTFEPCAMCTATLYWAGIGTLVYGAAETDLLELTGSHAENPTLRLPCREVLSRGQLSISVYGPIEAMRDELLAPHRAFWL